MTTSCTVCEADIACKSCCTWSIDSLWQLLQVKADVNGQILFADDTAQQHTYHFSAAIHVSRRNLCQL